MARTNCFQRASERKRRGCRPRDSHRAMASGAVESVVDGHHRPMARGAAWSGICGFFVHDPAIRPANTDPRPTRTVAGQLAGAGRGASGLVMGAAAGRSPDGAPDAHVGAALVHGAACRPVRLRVDVVARLLGCPGRPARPFAGRRSPRTSPSEGPSTRFHRADGLANLNGCRPAVRTCG